jgi:hypothetical protein
MGFEIVSELTDRWQQLTPLSKPALEKKIN